MLKVWNRAVSTPSVVLLATEGLVILSVFWASFIVNSVSWGLPSRHPVIGMFAVAGLCLISLSLHDLYVGPGVYSKWSAFRRIIQSIGLAAILVLGLVLVFPGWGLGLWFFAAFLALPFVLMVWRWIYENWVHQWAFQRKVLLVGSGRLADDVVGSLFADRDHAYDLVGRFVDFDHLGISRLDPLRPEKARGTLLDAVRKFRVESLVVSLDDSRGKLPIEDLLECRFSGVRIEDGLSFYERVTGRVHVDAVKPSWLIFSEGFSRLGIEWVKRVIDVMGAVVGIALTAPAGLVIAMLIKLDSRGPVFYRQERVGLGGRPFSLIKFRSMRQDAEAETGPIWAVSGDTRATRIGRWLRLLRLDELPQMINVLRGEMSFVGPRPERPCFVDELKAQIPYYAYRHMIKPGITGWAQVRYRYGASVQDSLEKLQYDLYYIKNLSMLLDVSIVVQTIKIILLGRGAR